MRILEETKDYIICYHPSPHPELFNYYYGKNDNSCYSGCLIDKSTNIEYHAYKKDTGNFEKDIISLGKKLIKKWKKNK